MTHAPHALQTLLAPHAERPRRTPRLLAAVVAALGLLTASACAPGDTAASEDPVEITGEVNIYSSRHYDTDLALYEDFTKATGIRVNRIEAGADALIERIVSEGEYSPADLLITVDAGRLWRAEKAGVLSPIASDVLSERIPENLRHPDGLWFGLSTRARVIIYNEADGKPEGLETYEDLADPRHRAKICMRSSSNIYNISLLSSLIAHRGEDAALDWARGVVSNFRRAPEGNDTANIEAVANGECGISVVNTYYLARYAGDEDTSGLIDKVGVVFPNQETTGTHVNISGAGLLKNAPNRDNAIRFLEYLTSDTAQGYFANGNNEHPAVEGVAPTSAVASLGEFRADDLSTATIGANQAKAVAIYDAAGWN
ncbi:MAG: Fe(3+) ABC transporter substrate-binding protein [Erythrobacter sp.]|uniref:Fe(3+) ABC transporter substrate-binding protein n=1 Tax=Erythrobacter sp. TaxID=1042 RepID=UPI002624D4E4|nr:Fe(3+) ABC transporter substrate-binding protein [Erythrobacter sp.]MDJ0978590.1 Fe(3+) ABC transporter substrate-binding protein [Erythrobacter sp.]